MVEPTEMKKEKVHMDWNGFVANERSSRDTIDVKRIYIDMAGGDLAAGMMLSALIYWYLPDKQGKSKLRVFKKGKYWVAKKAADWWDECRLTTSQVSRCIMLLEARPGKPDQEIIAQVPEGGSNPGKGGRPKNKQPHAALPLIETARFKFNGVPMLHFRLLQENFLLEYQRLLELSARSNLKKNSVQNGFKGQTQSGFSSGSLTQNTAEITALNSTDKSGAQGAPSPLPDSMPVENPSDADALTVTPTADPTRAEALTCDTNSSEVRPRVEPQVDQHRANETFFVAQALAEVCGKVFGANKGRLLAEAKILLAPDTQPHPTPELIRDKYGPGGWYWDNDWRGRRGDMPTPYTIRDTWGQWLLVRRIPQQSEKKSKLQLAEEAMSAIDRRRNEHGEPEID